MLELRAATAEPWLKVVPDGFPLDDEARIGPGLPTSAALH
jgi:hypothetical protein